MIQNREQLGATPIHEVALDCIEAGITATQPDHAIKNAVKRTVDTLEIDETTVDLGQYAEILVIGGGKASAQMARTVEEILGERITEGVVVTNDPIETDFVEVVEASHPIPDEVGIEGTKNVLSLAEQATDETLVLCLISGGGSALLSAPADGITLADLQSLTDDLLSSGATIHEINAVRKHLSAIKGGRLATAAAPATVVGLILSDVVGNDLGVIASGPIVPDTSTYDDARSVLQRYGITPPTTVKTHLERGAAGELPETPKSDEGAFERTQIHVLADGFTALKAAQSTAEGHGYTPVILSSRVEGEAREAAKTHVAIAEESHATGNPVAPPAVFLSGGETTVTMDGNGIGGPNQEFALSGALTLDSKGIVVASVDTDGSDGATDVAGALIDGETVDDLDRARTALAENDAYPYLADRNAIIETGPTGTNVNDLRVIVVEDGPK
ncbi:MAG TPA: glycerate kinase [Halococcus sp.]|nr:glycerate kinase [Halococcus sp.]